MIGLFAKQNMGKRSLEQVDIQKLASCSMCFYFKYFSSKDTGYYWRLLGKDNTELLSLEINNGLISSIELLSFDDNKVIKYDSNYTLFDEIIAGVPYLQLLPSNENISVTVDRNFIDNFTDFIVLTYKDAFKITWDEKLARIVLLNDLIALELSKENELIGIVIRKNLEDTFMEDSLDLTLYP